MLGNSLVENFTALMVLLVLKWPKSLGFITIEQFSKFKCRSLALS